MYQIVFFAFVVVANLTGKKIRLQKMRLKFQWSNIYLKHWRGCCFFSLFTKMSFDFCNYVLNPNFFVSSNKFIILLDCPIKQASKRVSKQTKMRGGGYNVSSFFTFVKLFLSFKFQSIYSLCLKNCAMKMKMKIHSMRTSFECDSTTNK